MRAVPHSATVRMTRAGGFFLGLAGRLIPTAVGQTNLDADILQTEKLHDLSPMAEFLCLVLWFLGAVVLVVAAVLFIVRQRAAASLDKTFPDAHWDEDAQEDAGEQVERTQVVEACEALKNPAPPVEAVEPAAEADPPHQARLFTPASGPAWGESMLKAFLGTCLKVNCLGRTWRESATRRLQSSHLPDPREAELIRRFMQRWQEFHVDPETGVFLEHASSAGKSRVCVISVRKAKRTVIEAAFNAGFVIESLGRYLKSTDLVYPRGPGHYHAPTKDELAAMRPGEKDSLMRITDITDPWQAMIAGPRGAWHSAAGESRTGAPGAPRGDGEAGGGARGRQYW